MWHFKGWSTSGVMFILLSHVFRGYTTWAQTPWFHSKMHLQWDSYIIWFIHIYILIHNWETQIKTMVQKQNKDIPIKRTKRDGTITFFWKRVLTQETRTSTTFFQGIIFSHTVNRSTTLVCMEQRFMKIFLYEICFLWIGCQNLVK